jgi:hypothetical protein
MTDPNLESASVLTAVHDAFEPVTMHTPLDTVVAQAGARRRRRRRTMSVTAVAAVTAVAGLAIVAAGHSPTTRSATPGATVVQPVHIVTAAYMVDSQPNGTVTVTWTKQGYFSDPSGLQAALHTAGFPVLVKVGEFCKGPSDVGYLDQSGVGQGVDQVMQASTNASGQVVFTFNRAVLPADTELFIGYLSPAQLAITHGAPGSVERLVPTNTTLTCTTQAPPAHSSQGPQARS